MWIWNCTEQIKDVIFKRIHDFKLNSKHPALLEILYEKDVITASEMDELRRYSRRFDTPRDMDKLLDIVSIKPTGFFDSFWLHWRKPIRLTAIMAFVMTLSSLWPVTLFYSYFVDYNDDKRRLNRSVWVLVNSFVLLFHFKNCTKRAEGVWTT